MARRGCRQVPVRPNAGLQAQRRGPREDPPEVYPWSRRAPWVQREDDVAGLPSGKARRVKVRDRIDLGVDRPPKCGGEGRVLSGSVQRQPRPGRPGEIASRIADVRHREDAKRLRVASDGEGAPSKEGSGHNGGGTREHA